MNDDALLSRLAPVTDEQAAAMVSRQALGELAEEIIGSSPDRPSAVPTDRPDRPGRPARSSRRKLTWAAASTLAAAAAVAVAVSVIATDGQPTRSGKTASGGSTAAGSSATDLGLGLDHTDRVDRDREPGRHPQGDDQGDG
jgi:hypothetical protein